MTKTSDVATDIERMNGSLGSRVRSERKRRGATLRDLAQECGISVSFLSQLERDLARPSVGTLHELAAAFDMSMAQLLSSSGEPGETSDHGARRYAEVVRADERARITYPGSGIINEMLTVDTKRALGMMWVVIPVGEGTGERGLVHDGEECGVIIQGRVGIWVGPPDHEQYLELGPGDAVYQMSKYPHRSRNIGDTEVIIVTAMTPPSL